MFEINYSCESPLDKEFSESLRSTKNQRWGAGLGLEYRSWDKRNNGGISPYSLSKNSYPVIKITKVVIKFCLILILFCVVDLSGWLVSSFRKRSLFMRYANNCLKIHLILYHPGLLLSEAVTAYHEITFTKSKTLVCLDRWNIQSEL